MNTAANIISRKFALLPVLYGHLLDVFVCLFAIEAANIVCLAQLLKRGTSFKLIHIGIEVTSISMLTSETTFSTFMFALYFTLIHSISLRHLRVKVNFGGANFAMKFARPNLISHKNQKQENCKK